MTVLAWIALCGIAAWAIGGLLAALTMDTSDTLCGTGIVLHVLGIVAMVVGFGLLMLGALGVRISFG